MKCIFCCMCMMAFYSCKVFILTHECVAVRKSFIGQNKSIWAPLELVEKLCPESADLTTSVRDMPGLK